MTAEDYTPWALGGKYGSLRRGGKRGKLSNLGSADIPRCVYAQLCHDQLNTDAVKKQLHVENVTQAWQMCALPDSVFSYTMDIKASQFVYEYLKGKGIRMLTFSGDKDGSVPTIGTENWINAMAWATSKDWTLYSDPDGQVAGYYQEYTGGLTFATVHGAGHMVPQDQRQRAYHLIFNWLLQRDEFVASESETSGSEENAQFIQ